MRCLSALSFCTLVACSSDFDLGHDAAHSEPVLSLDEPAPAAWLPAASTSVSGEARNLTAVTVNGERVEVEQGRYRHTLSLPRGISFLEARGVDDRGDSHFVRHGVIAGQFADPGSPVGDAADLRVNRGGLDVALRKVGDLVDPGAIEATLKASNPLFEDTWVFGNVTAAVYLDELRFDVPLVDADPRTGALSLDVTVPRLYVGTIVRGVAFGADFEVEVSAWADKADVTGAATLGIDRGHLVVDVDDVTVALDAFGYDTSLLPGDVESYILVDFLRGFIETTAADLVEEQVPALLASVLSELALSYSLELLGKPVSIEADFASAGVDSDGIALRMNVDVDIPGAGSATYAGYLTAPGAHDALSTSSDVSGAIADNLVNRVLFEAWRSGMLDLSMSTADGTLEPILLAPLHATEGSVRTTAKLPPVLVSGPAGLQAQIAEMEVRIDTPDGELGTTLEAAVGAVVDVEMKVRDGVLKLELGEPELVISVRDQDWGAASDEATTRLLEEMLPIDTLLALLGGIEIPIPAFAGVTIERAVARRDASDAHTLLEVSLR